MQEDIDIVFKKLFETLYPQLLCYAAGLVGEDDSEDLVEDVFVDLWNHRDTIEFGDKIRAYLYRAVFTHALNVLKRRKVTPVYISMMTEINEKRMEFIDSEKKNGQWCMENEDLRNEIEAAINHLPEKCREVFRLSYMQNMKNIEIAKVLDISLRTVEAHMYKALKMLREDLRHLAILIFFVFFE